MKKGIALVTALITAVSLLACGSSAATEKQEETTETTAAAETDVAGEESAEKSYKVEDMTFDGVELNIMTRITNETQLDYFTKLTEEFNNSGAGITVNVENIATEEDYLNKLRTAFASGETPNAFIEYGGTRVKEYIDANALVDLTPYLEADETYYGSFYDSALESVRYEGSDGTWGIPYQQYIILLFYNRDLFEQNNLEAPKTLDDLMNVCESLKANGIKPFQVGEKSSFRFGHFSNCLLYGTYGVDAAEKLADGTMQYDGSEMLGIYQTISDMYEKNYFGDDILSVDYATEKSSFVAGESAMIWGLNSDVMGTLNSSDVAFNVGVTAMPYGNEAYMTETQGGVNNVWYVSQMNKEQEEIDATVYWLKYITSDDSLNSLVKDVPNIFGRQFDMETDDTLMVEVMDIFNSMTAMKSDTQSYDDRSYMLDTVRTALQGLAMGSTPEDCAAQIVDQISANE